MILSFKTQNNGHPTNFVEMIWNALGIINYQVNDKIIRDLIKIDDNIVQKKLHTIRHDPKDLWKAGRIIHFTLFPRSKKMVRFAPEIPCEAVQNIRIYYHGDDYEVVVDDRFLDDIEIEKLAKNDGFDSVEDFTNWFNEDFTGKIIHWTDLRY